MSSLLLQTSAVALKKQKSLKIFEKKTSAFKTDLYTNVDVEIEEFLTEKLRALDKNCHVVGEESITQYTKTHSLKNAFSDTCFVIDPIDGTLNYTNNLPNWGISIGLVENNFIIAGAVALPELGEFFITHEGKTYYTKVSCSLETIDQNTELDYTQLGLPKTHGYSQHSMFAASYATGGKKARATNAFHINRSCVYSAIKTLTGSYFGYMCQAKLWDLIACISLCKTAGLSLYHNDRGELKDLSLEITEAMWKGGLEAQYEIVFAHNKEKAMLLLPPSS